MASETKTDAEKREALRAKIESSEQRNAERSLADQARGVADDAMDYVKANPLKTVAAVAVGALLIGAMTRPGRRAGRRAGAWAGLAGETALGYALGLFDRAGSATRRGQHRLGEIGGHVGNRARSWSRSAVNEGSELSDYVLDAARRGGRRASRTIDELRARLSN